VSAAEANAGKHPNKSFSLSPTCGGGELYFLARGDHFLMTIPSFCSDHGRGCFLGKNWIFL
jgi:hypothetical protein